ncbi:DedA family protein [Hippea maritima]|uniref:SNARE associated Golgi protein-like protein n=1 Tax=Hippea maritima (strain ATCC 700847 / DSM 10411 / MH2) TaxID=760142 RepID=F2LUE0_HIPMA|nr:DedA family protein [Hippea maritima]AEA33466.1 SNARE associated Golgi protein-like protein [Hippea maritima DSM 10411]
MLGKIVEFIVSAIGYGGYGGIFILMFLESSFFPFPSEVVVPPAAYLAAKGQMDLWIVIVSSILGSLAGALFNYFISIKLGHPFLAKYGKYVGLGEKTLKKVDDYFNKHGEISTFIGRLLPGIRQYISLPAGIARMNLVKFSIFTFLGAGIWVGILAFIGFSVGNNPEMVKRMLHHTYTYIVAFSLVLITVYLYIQRRRGNDRGI